jgi:WD40 repeat protein
MSSFGGGGRNSGFGGGGGRSSSSGGRGRYSGGGRGRSSRGSGGGRYNNNNSNNNRDGGGRTNSNVGGTKNTNFPTPLIKACGDYTKTGICNTPNCRFAKVVKLHAMIDASSVKQQQQDNNSYNNNNNRYNNTPNGKGGGPEMYGVSSVAIWETAGQVKIFSGSQDGYWRLWNFTGTSFVKEFEHYMGGSVEVLVVASNYLFCGFEAYTPALPEVSVGMVHAWNLASPNDPPLEFHMHTLLPYAHARAVTELLVVDGQNIVSGSKDGSIKLWTFDPASNHGKGGFVLSQTLNGHAREITGLAVAESLLWSCSTDGSIRIWDMSKNGECQHCITMASGMPDAVVPSPASTTGQGHTNAVTGLVSFQSAAGTFILSCSLDGDVKAWTGATGQLVASEGHGEGVVSMSMGADANGRPCLLLGLESGNIWVRNLEPTPKIQQAFAPVMLLSNYFNVAHDGAVKSLCQGPSGTFYTGGTDGKVLVYQFTGDLGL